MNGWFRDGWRGNLRSFPPPSLCLTRHESVIIRLGLEIQFTGTSVQRLIKCFLLHLSAGNESDI